MFSKIIKKSSSSLIPLANTTIQRNYSSAILTVPLKNNIINISSSSCGNSFSREVVFPRASMETLHSFFSFSKPGQAGKHVFIQRERRGKIFATYHSTFGLIYFNNDNGLI